MAKRTITNPTNSARTVFGLMGFAVIFSLIGNEVAIAQGPPNKPGQLGYGAAIVPVNQQTGQPLGGGTLGKSPAGVGFGTGAVIIIGGFVAAALLVALSGAGEAGRKFSVGLASVSATTSVLVYGGPAWGALNRIVNGKATGATTPTANTGATTPSAPTSGTDTIVAVAPIALGG